MNRFQNNLKDILLRKLGQIRYKFAKRGFVIPIPNKIQDIAISNLPEYVYFEGQKIFILRNGPVSVNLFYRGIWEENETRLVKNEIHIDDIVLDIGANIGYYTLIFANLVGPGGKIFSFEPEPTNFNLLKKNIEINGHQNITIENVAVSNDSGKIKLFLSEKDPGQHKIDCGIDVSNNYIIVNKISLDDYFKNNPLAKKISFIKIDVEGSEINVLKGMQNILNINKKLKILIEYSPKHIRNFGIEPIELLEFLKTNEFNFFLIESNGMIPTNEKSLLKISNDSVTNIFCKRD